MKAKWFFLTLGISILIAVTACAPGGNLSPVEPTASPETPTIPTPFDGGVPVPEAAVKAVELLAKEINLKSDQIVVQTIEEVQWRDGCLELAGEGEVCTAAITPGFRIVLTAAGETYEFHTDRTGKTVRRAPAASADEPGSLAAVKLAELAGLPLESIRVVRVEQVEWPDGCLGAAELGETCQQLIVPGYQFGLESEGRSYILHTNQEISEVRLGGPQETSVIVKVRQRAAEEGGVALRDVVLVSSQRVQWRDSCLGVEREGMMCMMVITPGYQILVKAGDTTLEYHTNLSASAIALFKP